MHLDTGSKPPAQENHGPLEDVVQSKIRTQLTVLCEGFPGAVRRVACVRLERRENEYAARRIDTLEEIGRFEFAINPELPLSRRSVRSEAVGREFADGTPERVAESGVQADVDC